MPRDAISLGLDGFAEVRTQHGRCVLKVMVTPAQRRASVFVPIHWNDSNASSARTGDLVAPCTDPISGQPEAKATPAAVAPVQFAWRGFAIARRPLSLPPGTWWARTAVGDACSCTFASNERRWCGTTSRQTFSPMRC